MNLEQFMSILLHIFGILFIMTCVIWLYANF